MKCNDSRWTIQDVVKLLRLYPDLVFSRVKKNRFCCFCEKKTANNDNYLLESVRMDRLTESNPMWINDELWEKACEPDCEEIDAVYRRLKYYEDLEEQGKLLKLPCEVGDTVYCIEDKKVWNCIVEKISISRANSATIEVTFPIETPDIAAIEYEIDDFGEYIFLTKSEAESKLKKLENEENSEMYCEWQSAGECFDNTEFKIQCESNPLVRGVVPNNFAYHAFTYCPFCGKVIKWI